jgi:hypothetical protein
LDKKRNQLRHKDQVKLAAEMKRKEEEKRKLAARCYQKH